MTRRAAPRPEVALVRWPHDAERLAELRASGRLRLVLVAPGADAPDGAGVDPREGWVRLPSDEEEVGLRIRHLLDGVPAGPAHVVTALMGPRR